MKKVVSDSKTFTNKGCKIAVQKNYFWGTFTLLSRIFWYWCFSLLLTLFLPPLPEVQCANFLEFWNPWGKVIERSGLRLKKKKLLIKGVKSLWRKKKFGRFLFVCIISLCLNVVLPPLHEGQCANFYFHFLEYGEK